ncbi:hypothetical protein CDSE_0813 [Candidatus Kinetoplastibacterium desouzaii TCC079E]|uniref:Smr domain-containing protein n=1 Tax=Candidatus Kinetoplastidibacterium desouzai TCC079E TaxID=1208919 RepID=M1LUU6_9PROT|nr:Smr/MutS family protein [Candidatus Kinetoplastibacterium desouzaii]AGF47069.1 hypothetical protein CDSE_0813 [Candidatus Kinetoplastibacterium desouzaii TCC079E]
MNKFIFTKFEDFKNSYHNKKKDIKTTRNKNCKQQIKNNNYDIIENYISDELDVSTLLSEDGTSYINKNSDPNTAKNLKNGKWQVKAKLDLHGLRVDSARKALNDFIQECYQLDMRCVIIIHGKGYGSPNEIGPILKKKVRSWLVQLKNVQAFSEPTEKDGGSGAVIILLRRKFKL